MTREGREREGGGMRKGEGKWCGKRRERVRGVRLLGQKAMRDCISKVVGNWEVERVKVDLV